MGPRVSSASVWLLVALAWLGLIASLPRGALSPVQHLLDHGYLVGHLLGLLGKPRTVAYGRVTPVAPRPSNGSLEEVQGWVSREIFQAEYLGKKPVIFRGAATQANGWDLECLWKYGSLEDALAQELGDRKVRIFRDQYDDESAAFMTFAKYQTLVQAYLSNKSSSAPYPRAFPTSHLKGCPKLVPVDTFESYQSFWSFNPHSQGVKQVVAFMSLLGDTNTKLHFDVGDSFFTEVYGRKRWVFIDPKYATELKIYGEKLNMYFTAGYDVFREQVPLHIPVQEGILQPGDVLYFPPMTFHAVENLDPVTMGIDEIRADLPSAFRRHWLCTLHSVLNPRTAYRSIEKLLTTGMLDGAELYFEEFSRKANEEF